MILKLEIFGAKFNAYFCQIPARKSAETFTKVWKECWWQLRIFKHKSYGEIALKPARGFRGEGCFELPSRVWFFDVFQSLAFSTCFGG